MADPNVRFILFALFSAVCLVAGYFARKRHPRAERFSQPIHLYTVIFFWTPVAGVAMWQLELSEHAEQVLIVLALQPVQMFAAWGVTVLVLRHLLHRSVGEVGVLILCAVLSNQGFTLGAYLCYAVLSPSDQAMSYAIAYVSVMQVVMIVVFYPVARHYAPGSKGGAPPKPSAAHGEPVPGGDEAEPPAGESVGRLIVHSFVDLRALPLYAAITGAVLSARHIPVPEWVGEYHIMEILFFAGAVGSYSGIGLRLRLGDSRKYFKLHAVLAAVRFVAVPAVILAAIGLLHLTPLALEPLPRNVVIIEVLTPSAIASVILPNLFGLDARLASVLWLWNTILFAVICLPIILLVF